MYLPEFDSQNPADPSEHEAAVTDQSRRRGRPRRRHEADHPRSDRRRGRGRNRGDVRAALLLLLSEQPRHGYELIQEISERTDGAWRPSPGSVYPALQLLQDEGLVVVEVDDANRNVARLTSTGTDYVEANTGELEAIWGNVSNPASSARRDTHQKLRGMIVALKQVEQVGTNVQIQRAGVVVEEAQRKLYAILAEAPTDQD